MDQKAIMGTYGSIRGKTQETTEATMLTISQNGLNHQRDAVKLPDDLSNKNQQLQNGTEHPNDHSEYKVNKIPTEHNTLMASEQEQRPQRQKYVNNRTSKLYELTLPVSKTEVDPQAQIAIDEHKSAIEKAVKILKDAEDIISDNVLECLKVCKNPYCDGRINLYRYTIGQHLCDLGFCDVFCKFLNNLHNVDLFKPGNELAVSIFRTLKGIVWNFTNVSIQLCLELGKAGAIPIILSSLTRKEFLPTEITEPLFVHIKGSLGIISNMVRLAPDNRKLARESDAVKVLREYSSVECPMLQAKCFIILSFLITDAEVNLLESTDSAIVCILDLLATSLTAKSGLAKGFGTAEILLALNNLALHDKNKVKVVEYDGLAQLTIVLQLQETQSNKEAVQILAAELTWKLSFIEANREKIKNENGLIEAITFLRSSANGKLKTACSGALWETYEGIFEEADDTSTRPTCDRHQTTDLKKVNHVMLSYQWDVQPRIILLKQKLQNAGYKVWMDIDQMGGDLLEAMASAIENSSVVLACVSQKYKDSTSCRTEATYAYKQNKPIIPLIVQPNYTADGWLGAFIGTLKYFPLYKDSMVATEFQNIKNEIGERGKINSQTKDVICVSTTDGPTNKPQGNNLHGCPFPNEVSTWTCKHVSDWLKQNKMCELCNVMKNVNGKILIQMYKMSTKSPDFFYTRLERDFKMNNLMQILKFSSAIDDLLE